MKSAAITVLKGVYYATALCACGAGTLILADYAIVKHQERQIRRAFNTKQKLNTKASSSTLSTRDIERYITPKKEQYFAVLHGEKNIGKSATLKEFVGRTKGVRYVDLKDVVESSKDPSMVLATALAKAFNLNLRFIGVDLRSRLFTKYQFPPAFKVELMLRMYSDVTIEMLDKKRCAPIVIIDNIHDDVAASLGEEFDDFTSQAMSLGQFDPNTVGRFVFVTNDNRLPHVDYYRYPMEKYDVVEFKATPVKREYSATNQNSSQITDLLCKLIN